MRTQAVGACDLLKLTFDLEECCLAEAIAATEGETIVARALEFCEEPADLGGEFFGGAEVEGALASILAIDEAVVGAEAAIVAGAVGGDDGAGVGEKGGVSADEVEGRFGHGFVGGWRAYVYTRISIQIYMSLSIGKVNSCRVFGGIGVRQADEKKSFVHISRKPQRTGREKGSWQDRGRQCGA
jgi:hypothetical protein